MKKKGIFSWFLSILFLALLLSPDKAFATGFNLEILSNQTISSILIIIAIVSMTIELFSPGFGFFGIISILSFAMFFLGNYAAGNSNFGEIIIFVAGVLLLLVEIAAPGFGLPGILGLVLVFLGLSLSMENMQTAAYTIAISATLGILTGIIMLKFGFKSKLFNKMVLNTRLSQDEKEDKQGERDNLLNREAITLTNLRPSGTIEIDGKKFDAITEGEYIEKNNRVMVNKIEGNKIVVRRINGYI